MGGGVTSLNGTAPTGFLGFENNLSNACACTTIFPKANTVALALSASILQKGQEKLSVDLE